MIEVSGGYGTASTPGRAASSLSENIAYLVRNAKAWRARCLKAEAELRAVRLALEILEEERDAALAERDQLAAELAAARAGRERLRGLLRGLLRGGFGMNGLYGGGDRGCPPRARPSGGTYKPLDFDSK